MSDLCVICFGPPPAVLRNSPGRLACADCRAVNDKLGRLGVRFRTGPTQLHERNRSALGCATGGPEGPTGSTQGVFAWGRPPAERENSRSIHGWRAPSTHSPTSPAGVARAMAAGPRGLVDAFSRMLGYDLRFVNDCGSSRLRIIRARCRQASGSMHRLREADSHRR